ncbi:hypothetical protein [Pseudonocardia xishanensis]|uniref:Amidohydrolase family protein n=1 Tax=Pseudonocardia xishanensis TaxID=630995 RepID=A0ABP8RHK4_9PSEU
MSRPTRRGRGNGLSTRGGDLLLRDVRPGGAAETDVLVRDGRIAEVGPGLDAAGATVEEGGGALLLPGLVDAHCHVDKTYWGRWVPNTAGPTLADRIDNERARRGELGIPSVEAISGLLDHMVARGTAVIRTHTSIDPEVGLARVEAVEEAAGRHAGRVRPRPGPRSTPSSTSPPGTAAVWTCTCTTRARSARGRRSWSSSGPGRWPWRAA